MPPLLWNEDEILCEILALRCVRDQLPVPVINLVQCAAALDAINQTLGLRGGDPSTVDARNLTKQSTTPVGISCRVVGERGRGRHRSWHWNLGKAFWCWRRRRRRVSC